MEREDFYSISCSFLELCFDVFNKGGRSAFESQIPFIYRVILEDRNGSTERTLEVLNFTVSGFREYITRPGMTVLFSNEMRVVSERVYSQYSSLRR
jgi:hypothetical protein